MTAAGIERPIMAPERALLLQGHRWWRHQRFELTPEDTLKVSVRSFGREVRATYRLTEMKSQPARIRSRAVLPAILGTLTAAVFVSGVVHGIVSPQDDPVTATFVTILFGVFTMTCWRWHRVRNVDIVAYYSATTGRALITPWYRKPNPAAFETFFSGLTRRIERAHHEARVEQPSDLERQLRSLDRLLKDGLIAREEFDRQRAVLLGIAPPPRPIGFHSPS